MEMTEVIIQLANQLGIASTELIKIYAEPRALIGLLTLISTITVIGFALLSGALTYHKLKENDSLDPEGQVMLSVLVGVVSAGILALITAVISDAILNIHYPEYMAVDMLLNKFLNIE